MFDSDKRHSNPGRCGIFPATLPGIKNKDGGKDRKGIRKMKVLSLVNQKGGVAKTTTAAALADYFSRQGKKTLLIDFDPQGSLTTALGLSDDTDCPQALRFLALDKAMAKSQSYELCTNLDVITSDMGLEKANILLINKLGKERYLRRAIDSIAQKEKYDYVILDSNPSFSQLTINVLYASDYVIVPFKPEYNSFKGIMQLFENIKEIKEISPTLNILGFVITMARHTKSTEEAVSVIKQFADEQHCVLFKPAIRLAVAAADAPSYGISLFKYQPNSEVAKDYEQLCGEILRVLEEN